MRCIACGQKPAPVTVAGSRFCPDCAAEVKADVAATAAAMLERLDSGLATFRASGTFGPHRFLTEVLPKR